MKQADLLRMFAEVDSLNVECVLPTSGTGPVEYHVGQAGYWHAKASTTLETCLPPGHNLVREFREVSQGTITNLARFARLRGIFRAARHMLEAGQLSSFAAGIRAETVDEILDQANQLVAADHVVAAAVLAGGALETHLRGLCVRHGLSWTGDGSISKYDGAIAQARNAGTATAYDAINTKQVSVWGAMRNKAAHDPTSFVSTSADDIRRMIEGIREFIARTT